MRWNRISENRFAILCWEAHNTTRHSIGLHAEKSVRVYHIYWTINSCQINSRINSKTKRQKTIKLYIKAKKYAYIWYRMKNFTIATSFGEFTIFFQFIHQPLKKVFIPRLIQCVQFQSTGALRVCLHFTTKRAEGLPWY